MAEESLSDVTLAIPAYRCARYLGATVAAALRVPGARILITEDCGGDETLAVAKSLAKKAPDRIRVIANEKNLGMTPNWQKCLGSVETPLGMLLCDDDVISPPYVIAAAKLLRARPDIAMAAGLQSDVAEDYALQGEVAVDEAVGADDFTIMTGTEPAAFALKWSPYAAAASMLFRMDAWRKAGGFNLKLGWCPDREMWFRLGRNQPVAICFKQAVHYRVLTTSVTADHRRSDKFCYDLSDMLKSCRRTWPERELNRGFKRNFAITSKAFFGSSVRAMKWGRWGQVLPRMGRGVGDFWRSL